MSRIDQAQQAQTNAFRSLAAEVAKLAKRARASKDERLEIVALFVELGFDEDESLDAIETV